MKFLFGSKKVEEIDYDAMQDALAHIESYWDILTRSNPKDNGTLIGLPHKYIIPAAEQDGDFHFEEQYYWDSYITALGLTKTHHQPIVEGMLENLIVLFNRFGLIPNASRIYMTGHSQPPVLTSYIFLVYDRYAKSDTWLKKRIEVAKKEYEEVWMNDRHPFFHKVHRGLSRYYDFSVLHDSAEMESGWDMTPRFSRKCLDFLPVDLNSLLYKYEMDFARAARIFGNNADEGHWQARANIRKETVSELMWGRNRKFFFDYNYRDEKRGWVWSLAAYYTMWAGLATEEQAEHLVRQIKIFRKKGGLSTTRFPFVNLTLFGSIPTQWAYPNGWAPLHYFTIEGLKRYGYSDLAKSIALDWLNNNTQWFKNNGTFMEKYNVVSTNKKQAEGVYAHQIGFGWTNGVYVRLYEDFVAKNGASQK